MWSTYKCLIVILSLLFSSSIIYILLQQSPNTTTEEVEVSDSASSVSVELNHDTKQEWKFDETLRAPPWRHISEVYVTEEEKNFPLAYSILAYTDPEQVLLLLRAIYRSHNYYCIHVDKKAAPHVKVRMYSLFNNNPNLTNVFIPSQPVSVKHSSFSTLKADLICMRHLLERSKSWRYFINLTGQEYPRKTNLELVRILKDAMNGSNLMHKDMLLFNRVIKRLWDPPPHGMHLWKGWVHIVVKREFVEFVINDERAKDLASYLKGTIVPDESFFSTLNHNQHLKVPGGYMGIEFTGDYYPYVNRLKVWKNIYSPIPCHGTFVRFICVFGDENYAHLTSEEDPSLFINKFILSMNGKLLEKIDRWFHQRQRMIYSNPENVNISFYQENMPQARYHFP